jgi:hypothetical protein
VKPLLRVFSRAQERMKMKGKMKKREGEKEKYKIIKEESQKEEEKVKPMDKIDEQIQDFRS